MLLSFRYFLLCHPTPLRSQAFVAMQSIMLAMGPVGQMKLACAWRVVMKHLERSYSTLCCSVSDNFSFVTQPPCVHRHLWQCYLLCLRWRLWSNEACMCVKGWNKAFGEKLFNFMLLSFRYFLLCHPTRLRSQAFVAMQSIMLAMGPVGQMKLACAWRVVMKHLERSYSTLCCSVSDNFSFVTQPPCVHRHLWQCNLLCLPWGLWVNWSLHVQ